MKTLGLRFMNTIDESHGQLLTFMPFATARVANGVVAANDGMYVMAAHSHVTGRCVCVHAHTSRICDMLRDDLICKKDDMLTVTYSTTTRILRVCCPVFMVSDATCANAIKKALK